MTGPSDGRPSVAGARGACPRCGDALRPLEHATLGRLEGYRCPRDDYAWYGPRAIEAARTRRKELADTVTGVRGGVELILHADTHCPLDGRKDVCSAHRFINGAYYADLVIVEEFGRFIKEHLGARASSEVRFDADAARSSSGSTIRRI